LLEEVRKIWNQHKDSEEFSALTAQRPNPDQVEEQMRQAEVRSILDLMTQASLEPAAVLDRDYSNILALEMEPLVSMFRASKLLSRNAWISAQRGDQKGAAQDLLTCSRLVNFGLQDVTLMGWLIGMAVDSRSLEGAQDAISALPPGSFSSSDWADLANIWKDHERNSRELLCRVIDAERVLYGEYIFGFTGAEPDQISQDIIQSIFPSTSESPKQKYPALYYLYHPVARPLLFDDYSFYLQATRAIQTAIEKGAHDDPMLEEQLSRIPKLAILTKLDDFLDLTARGLSVCCGYPSSCLATV
jgi:hypothetical protein